MTTSIQPIKPRFSSTLSELARELPAEGLTLHELLERLGEHGLLLLCMVLTVPFLIPASIPGSSIPFGVVIALNGVGLLIHKPPWLPARLMQRRLAVAHLLPVLTRGAQLFVRLERLTRPRLALLTQGRLINWLNGSLLVLSGLLLTAPLPLPFSNTLPAYAALLLAAGSLEHDGYLILAGYVMVLLTLAYFGVLAAVGGIGLRAIWNNV